MNRIVVVGCGGSEVPLENGSAVELAVISVLLCRVEVVWKLSTVGPLSGRLVDGDG